MQMPSQLLALCVVAGLAACSVKPVTFTSNDGQRAEDCAAVGDEDGNGLADCRDPACAGAPSCQPGQAVCGNSIVDPGEECDGTAGPQPCSSSCHQERCGNGILDPAEECDGTAGLQPCSPSCRQEVCGNGIVDPGEQCDAAGDSATCDRDCTPAACGDLHVNAQAGEQCDDGNRVSGDGCSSTCKLEVCGNGIVDPGEQCDAAGDSATCDSDCTIATCGDLHVNLRAGEQCDDGGATSRCDADCTFPRCGDGQLNPAAGEELDPPSSPSMVVPVNDLTCRYDFSAINQLFCAGTCGTWGGGNGCQQADADAFCRLKTGNPSSTAASFTLGVAMAAPGICCPSVDPNVTGCTPLRTFDDRGVPQFVSVHETSLVSTHGPGQVITNVACTNP
jgi:cysteine-rich repeat protein